ncbi:hypothetical protein [Mycolicibacterium wolinskyi]|uniref:hypothetical protein n=1 Tax=Mycolicibacterium wolinskyi TaxID=59750 RepID=UPI003BAAD738
MALDAPLNARQIEVLSWISDGCPDGRWSDFTFKTTATALSSRRLVAVSKRGGMWSATILPAGEHYLAKGDYPAGHWTRARRSQGVNVITVDRPTGAAVRPVADRCQTTAAVETGDQRLHSRARELVDTVIEAGGEIHRESKDGTRTYSSLIAAVNRHKLAPEGKKLTIEMGSRWEIAVIRLENAPYWRTMPASEVVEAQRIGKWHPALAPLRAVEFVSMSVTAERRMLRILQAVAVECEARGWGVESANPERSYHYRQSRAGHVAIGIRDHRYLIGVWQKYREVPPPRWGQPPKRPPSDPQESLAVGLLWEAHGRSGITESWSDSPAKRGRVERLLPKVLWELERRADQTDRRQEQERLAAIERERLLTEAERRARVVHAENVRGEVLRAQHAQWREVLQLREYLGAMDMAIDQLPEVADRTAALEWRDWCLGYVNATLDPLAHRLELPDIREWTLEERDSLVNSMLRQLKREESQPGPFA